MKSSAWKWLGGLLVLLVLGIAISMLRPGPKPSATAAVDSGLELTLVQGKVTDEAGNPIPQAALMAYRLEIPKQGEPPKPLEKSPVLMGTNASSQVPMAIADEQGKFQFYLGERARVPPESPLFQVQASAPGYEPSMAPLLVSGKSTTPGITGTEELSFALARSNRKHDLLVVDKRSQKPVAGATVSLVCGSEETKRGALWETTSSEAGTVNFVGVPEKESACGVLIVADGYTNYQVEAKSTALPAKAELLGLGRWRGVMKEAVTGTPVIGATLKVYGIGKSVASITSDRQGKFQVDKVPVGIQITYRVESEDHVLVEPIPPAIVPPETFELEQDIVLEQSFVVEGIVVDSREVGVANARVVVLSGKTPGPARVAPGHTAEATTDRGGRFKLYGILPDLKWTVVTNHEDFVESMLPDQLLTRGTPLKIVLEDGAALTVNVKYEPGNKPAEGIWVRRTPMFDAGTGPLVGAEAIKADKNGQVKFGKTSGGQYLVEAVRDDSDTKALASQTVQVAKGTTTVDLTVTAPGGLMGRITTDSQVPTPDGVVLELDEKTQMVKGESRVRVINGSYALEGVPDGTYQVRASVPGGATVVKQGVKVAAGSGPTRLDLHFPTGNIFHGVVTGEGHPIEGASVFVYPYPTTEGDLDVDHGPPEGRFVNLVSGKTEADGTFDVRGLDPSTPVRVDVMHPEWAPWTSGKTYAAGPPSGQLVVQLVRPSKLAIQLKRSDGGKIEEVVCTLTHETRGRFKGNVITGQDGKADFNGIPAGNYNLWLISMPPQGSVGKDVNKTVTLTPGKTTTAEIDITF